MLNLWRWGPSSWAIILKIAIKASVSVSNHPSEARDVAIGLEEQTSTKIRIGTCFYLVRAPTNPANASIYLVLQGIVLTTLRCQASITQLVSVVIPLWISITAGLKLNMLCFQLQNLDWEILFQQGGIIPQAQSFETVLEDGCQGCLIQEHGKTLRCVRPAKSVHKRTSSNLAIPANQSGPPGPSIPRSRVMFIHSKVQSDATRSFQISDTLWKHAVVQPQVMNSHPLKLLQGFQYCSMQSILVHTWNVLFQHYIVRCKCPFRICESKCAWYACFASEALRKACTTTSCCKPI